MTPLGRWPWSFLLAMVLVALVASPVLTAPQGEVAAQIENALQAEEPVFISRVETSPLPNPVPMPQDVAGAVLDRNGRGLPGVWVKVKSEGGWEASTATRSDGGFYFTLTEGQFSMVLIDRVGQPAFFRVNGQTAIRVVFQEVASGATPTPTPPPTLAPTSPTAGPQPTSPPTRPRGTPTPSVTPLSSLPPTPAPANPSLPGLPGTDPWVSTFVAGIGLGAAVFLGALVALRRRR